MDCLLCSETNLKKSFGFFLGTKENRSFVCRNCAECRNCETKAIELEEDYNEEDDENYDDDENKYVNENNKDNEDAEKEDRYLAFDDGDGCGWILIPIKTPFFPGGWAFFSEEELNKHYTDDKGLICGYCKDVYLCNKCVKPSINQHWVKMYGICSNPCKKCDSHCNYECECSLNKKYCTDENLCNNSVKMNVICNNPCKKCKNTCIHDVDECSFNKKYRKDVYLCNKCVKPSINVKIFGNCSNPCKDCGYACSYEECECLLNKKD